MVCVDVFVRVCVCVGTVGGVGACAYACVCARVCACGCVRVYVRVCVRATGSLCTVLLIIIITCRHT